jgi:hypothetical protein
MRVAGVFNVGLIAVLLCRTLQSSRLLEAEEASLPQLLLRGL